MPGALAVVPPSTALESPPVGMDLNAWIVYGSIVTGLGILFVGAVALILRLVREVFKT